MKGLLRPLAAGTLYRCWGGEMMPIDFKGASANVPRALRRSSRRTCQADVHWRDGDGEMHHTTLTLETLPEPFGVFVHPDVAQGRSMQITALSIDERQRRVRLDLADGAQRRAKAG